MQTTLPAGWVDSLFARLQVRYGSAWTRMWEGVDLNAVKADWAEELAGLANAPESIKHALAHLPIDRPPNVGQFRALCIAAPSKFVALPAPDMPPERKAEVSQMLRIVRAKLTSNGADA